MVLRMLIKIVVELNFISITLNKHRNIVSHTGWHKGWADSKPYLRHTHTICHLSILLMTILRPIPTGISTENNHIKVSTCFTHKDTVRNMKRNNAPSHTHINTHTFRSVNPVAFFFAFNVQNSPTILSLQGSLPDRQTHTQSIWSIPIPNVPCNHTHTHTH